MKNFFFVALISLSVNAFAQKVGNKLTFQKGEKLEITTNMNSTSTSQMMGQSMESTTGSTFQSVYEVGNASPDSASMIVQVKRIKFDAQMMGRNETFDSDNADDLKDNIGKMIKPILDKKYTVTVNTTGTVTSVKDDVDKKSKSSNNNAMIGMMMGGAGSDMSTPKIGDATLFKILPDHEVGKGDTWKSESSSESGKRTTTYTIADITDNDVLIDFTEESTLTNKQQMMGQDASVDVKSKSTGKIILDRKTGLLKQKTFLTNSEQNMNLGGMQIPSTSKATTTITVKVV